MSDLIPLEFVKARIPDRARPAINLLRGELNRLGYTASDDVIYRAWCKTCFSEFGFDWLDVAPQSVEQNCKDMMQYLGRVN